MTKTEQYKQDISEKGFTVVPHIYTSEEVESIIAIINQADTSNPTFRKSSDLFAIRQFIKEVPELIPYIFTDKLYVLIQEQFGKEYFAVKSIYFDKPEESNWFVAYHQDLTISVKEKVDINGFGPWSVKQNQFAVQPPLAILENSFTLRIHLDDTDEHNGALRVVPGSHTKGIYRAETINWDIETEVSCNVPKGGVMIMKPLLLHASGRTTNKQRRRVIHIECSNQTLPQPLQWAEQFHLSRSYSQRVYN